MQNANIAAGGPSPDTIQRMFDRLAPRYDLFNRLASAGMDGGWRRATLAPLKPGMRVLDMGCGTGDLALAVGAKLKDGGGEVVGLDFSVNMLAFAKRRYEKSGLTGKLSVRWVHRSAGELPYRSEPFDLVISGFVLRNLYGMMDRVLEGVYRSLGPGGQISFVDFTEPPNPVIRVLWRFYMNTVVTLYGKLLFGKNFPMFYMTDSAKRFLKKDEFVALLSKYGFRDVTTRSFMFGIVVLYRATR